MSHVAVELIHHGRPREDLIIGHPVDGGPSLIVRHQPDRQVSGLDADLVSIQRSAVKVGCDRAHGRHPLAPRWGGAKGVAAAHRRASTTCRTPTKRGRMTDQKKPVKIQISGRSTGQADDGPTTKKKENNDE